MKKYFILPGFAAMAVFIFAFTESNDNRTLFTVDGDKVTVSEFEYVYNKNNVNNQANYSDTSLNDYLTLYENFRLKVKEAEAMRLDTISSLKGELEGYRKQLAKSYLTDREISDKLIEEAYQRSKTEIEASHILIRCDENADPTDTLLAYKRIVALRKKIEKGESFEKVARDSSEDPSAKKNDGNIGWFTVFGTIYPFESAAYNLKPGQLSEPVRTEFGYHLVRVNEVRPARGQIHVAHVLIRFPDKADAVQQEAAHKKADSIYALITKGKITFDDAVKQFSDDKGTRGKEGELPWFGTGAQGHMVAAFEDASFALKKDGDISKPIMTQYGWHIIKRIEVKDMPSYSDAKADLKKKVERDSRSAVAKNVLIKRIKNENGFVQYPEALNDFKSKTDTSLTSGHWKAGNLADGSKVLFKLAGKDYTGAELSEFIEKNPKRHSDKSRDVLINEYYESFVDAKCLEYDESTLDAKNPDFRNLMKEYKDGILLFELMDRMVWTKAVKDSTGLEAYRKMNANKYMWGKRAEVAIFNCSNKKICDEAYKMAEKNKTPDEIKEKLNKEGSESRVSVIEGKYEKGQYDVVDNTGWKVGITSIKEIKSAASKPGDKSTDAIASTTKNSATSTKSADSKTAYDTSYQFVWVKQIVGPEPKTLKEAKGYIVSDYQEYLEKTWLAELRQKYPVKVDESVFRSLVKK